jgi:hypothetical protein
MAPWADARSICWQPSCGAVGSQVKKAVHYDEKYCYELSCVQRLCESSERTPGEQLCSVMRGLTAHNGLQAAQKPPLDWRSA